MNDPLANQSVPTRRQALRLARMMGCSGAHQTPDGAWLPCESTEAMTELIRHGKKAARVQRMFDHLDKPPCDCDDSSIGRGGKRRLRRVRRHEMGKKTDDAIAVIEPVPADVVAPEPEVKRYDHYARDGDLDGLVQDGTPNERRSRTLSARRISKKPKRRVILAARLRDMPYPYTEENLDKN